MNFKTKLLIFLFLPSMVSAQGVLFDQIQEIKSQKDFSIFQLVNETVGIPETLKEEVKEGLLIDLDFENLQRLKRESPEFLELSFPLPAQGTIKVDLMKVDLLKTNNRIFTSSGTAVNYEPGLYYRGAISEEAASVVAISIFEDEIIGMISTANGNFIIGKLLKGNTSKHIIYNDRALQFPSSFTCDTPDDGLSYPVEDLVSSSMQSPGDCIDLYLEIDNDIVVNKGGTNEALNYITGLFNESFTLYANDGISMALGSVKVWDTPSPYTAPFLTSYQNLTDTFDGDLSHLVSFQSSGGIAAGFSGICNPDPDESKCFSSLETTYVAVPLYSYSVEVVTHEMGHLIGSRHTHACVWNGNNTAIDGCAGFTEGGCTVPPSPSDGGTIMSYCHLSTGIDFRFGFGSQPLAVLQNTIDNASCLGTSCGMAPLSVELRTFSAVPQEQNIFIQWETATEIDHDYFVLERSLDGRNWNKINRQEGKGENTQNTIYDYLDTDPLGTKNYYRLAIVAFDGQVEFSKVLVVELAPREQSRVFPNPVKDELNVVFPKGKNAYSSFQLFNAQGELIKGYQIEENMLDLVVQTNSLVTGLYLYTLSDTKGFILESGRFLKQ